MRGSNTAIMRGMSATSLRTTSSSAGLNSNEAYREVGRQAFEDAKYQMTQEQKMNLLRKTKRLDQDKIITMKNAPTPKVAKICHAKFPNENFLSCMKGV